MEIQSANFTKYCLLLKEGYVVNGANCEGYILQKPDACAVTAKRDIKKVCGVCGCNTEGNCRSEAEDWDPAEIFAKIS